LHHRGDNHPFDDRPQRDIESIENLLLLHIIEWHHIIEIALEAISVFEEKNRVKNTNKGVGSLF